MGSPRRPVGPVTGVVESWSSAHGWGVLVTPDGIKVWTSFFHLAQMDRTPVVGDLVRFSYETPGQDGYPARALSPVQVLA